VLRPASSTKHKTNLRSFSLIQLAVEKHRATYIAPLGIGASFFITQMFGVYFTGGMSYSSLPDLELLLLLLLLLS
jgi:hypothetical protein